MMEGRPVVADPYFDVLLSDVKNERREGEEGVVTLGEIAADMGFENRCEVNGSAATVQSPLNGVVRGRYSRCFVPCVIKFRSKAIKTAFLVDTGGTCTYLGKPTWDKLLEGLEDVGGNTLRVTLNGETRQEVTLSPQDRHFQDIDLIGTDFFNHMEARFRVDYKTKACALEWDEP
mmetsp:Transcript_23155/g.64387  ORF Transcript_23155/g.64387 Transcript_23155/m.64387 type:complete len:175 (+) Transcript_23155:138-662(+)